MTTRTLRASALGFGLPFLLALPIADSTIGLGDRAQVLSAYSADAAVLNAYTLTAEVGSFALTGQAATFGRTYRLTADRYTFSLVGQPATLSRTTVTPTPTPLMVRRAPRILGWGFRR